MNVFFFFYYPEASGRNAGDYFSTLIIKEITRLSSNQMQRHKSRINKNWLPDSGSWAKVIEKGTFGDLASLFLGCLKS